MKSKGFTIVELLIVLTIVGILTLLVVNTLRGIQARNQDDAPAPVETRSGY